MSKKFDLVWKPRPGPCAVAFRIFDARAATAAEAVAKYLPPGGYLVSVEEWTPPAPGLVAALLGHAERCACAAGWRSL
jgi:hypothetical protein